MVVNFLIGVWNRKFFYDVIFLVKLFYKVIPDTDEGVILFFSGR